jgi:hypothetical protein
MLKRGRYVGNCELDPVSNGTCRSRQVERFILAFTTVAGGHLEGPQKNALGMAATFLCAMEGRGRSVVHFRAARLVRFW